ncbi:hypothetical protein BAY61_08605 [Prauserella marina]|uniref:Uncharacterized protein n=1 Tax=Prauserella marina TaxID=530584 RepID=A0A222VM76_9PSEU|nr:hypothetical protein [Prauserella marina]ASR35029.1 hypothetical protein BAY61_08605 [Prauserella marina]PWV85235.1 hypothetical protein DES30_1011259 [Prauserella marina]SDC01734.1 hypothetical protein SAMN05421630_10179 [Prauserella marina]
MRTGVVGSIVGAIAGAIFVLVNAESIPATLFWRVLAGVAFVASLGFAVWRRPEADHAPPTRKAMRTYGFSVMAMMVAIPAGAAIISSVFERPNAVLAWVVFVVGAHFLPFARAFHLPFFRWLAMTLIVVSAVGAITTLVLDSAVSSGWTGVAAGFVLLTFAALGPGSPRRGRQSTRRLSSPGATT